MPDPTPVQQSGDVFDALDKALTWLVAAGGSVVTIVAGYTRLRSRIDRLEEKLEERVTEQRELREQLRDMHVEMRGLLQDHGRDVQRLSEEVHRLVGFRGAGAGRRADDQPVEPRPGTGKMRRVQDSDADEGEA